jgi:hypothetical protein
VATYRKMVLRLVAIIEGQLANLAAPLCRRHFTLPLEPLIFKADSYSSIPQMERVLCLTLTTFLNIALAGPRRAPSPL